MTKLEKAGYEVAVFDLSPGISNLEKSILTVMDEVIGVAAAEYFSVDGLEVFTHELEKLRKDRRATFISNKLVVNRVNKSLLLPPGSPRIWVWQRLPAEHRWSGFATAYGCS